MNVFLCQNSFDGILSGIFEVYASKINLDECRLELEDQYEPALFAKYRIVQTEAWKAERVAKKIRTDMSEEVYIRLYRAALHHSPDRADWILRFVGLGLQYKRRVRYMLQEPAVYEIFQMDRYVGREACFLREVARFECLKSGIYYCKVGPVNQVLELVAEYFADRFTDMNWIIYDEVHGSAALHSKNGWLIHHGITDSDIEQLTMESEKDIYVDLWKVFFKTIAIKERKNERCQRTLLPLRYRKYIVEFQDNMPERSKEN